MPRQIQSLSDFLIKYYENIDSKKSHEIWKKIKIGEKPLYEISTFGRIRRIDNKMIINPFHSYRKNKNGDYDYNRPTYLRVQLYYYENGKRKKKHFEISRLVALHFIPIPKRYIENGLTSNDLEVNHINGGYRIYDNSIDNLEWCTQKENIDRAINSGLRHPPKGVNHHTSYLNENDVIQICECIENGYNAEKTYKNISLSENISYKKFKPTFYNIKYKKSWVFISKEYNF